MHRIYADHINSRDISRFFCDLHSPKTSRGILPGNSNIILTFYLYSLKIIAEFWYFLTVLPVHLFSDLIDINKGQSQL